MPELAQDIEGARWPVTLALLIRVQKVAVADPGLPIVNLLVLVLPAVAVTSLVGAELPSAST